MIPSVTSYTAAVAVKLMITCTYACVNALISPVIYPYAIFLSIG